MIIQSTSNTTSAGHEIGHQSLPDELFFSYILHSKHCKLCRPENKQEQKTQDVENFNAKTILHLVDQHNFNQQMFNTATTNNKVP